ncbi:uncharacterized protein RJT21DRAFT_20580 [Scheffersomyces amazonensis]|uniref:uncharacterized protein n=1 Tax=Scheffersomyces amazonensis TaxID=1078765 RepID=UPI00315D3BB7
MSTANDNKENSPSTPTKSTGPGYPFPSGKVLKPISPNKYPNAGGVGKLNFLQSDNIDEHFDHIHSFHGTISEQLYNLEVQSKQTSVDLGQLVDRSKNNNQNLNRLLENIAKYSDEVITEGNATKNDIEKLISKLDEIKGNIEKSHVQDQDLKKAITDEVRNSKSQHQIEVLEKLTYIVQNLPEHDLVRQVVDPIVAELKCVSLDPKSQSLLEGIMENFGDKEDPFAVVQDLRKDLVQRLDSLSTREEDYIIELEKRFHKQDQLINELISIVGLKVNKKELESNIQLLDDKYKRMTQDYTAKYVEFQNLQQEFDKLSKACKELTIPNQAQDLRISKAHQLHLSTINSFGNPSLIVPKKRIVSSPLINLPATNDEDQEDYED